jgi:hypothetical protein
MWSASYHVAKETSRFIPCTHSGTKGLWFPVQRILKEPLASARSHGPCAELRSAACHGKAMMIAYTRGKTTEDAATERR